MKRPRSPQHSEGLDYEGDEAEASSQPSSSSPWERKDGFLYDVFLSFRGADTRKTFTGHLHQALKDKGIITFIDNENLEKGQKVEQLFRYIQKSKIFVPIFSKGYADSEWCLKEITKIMESGRLIIPVFFLVEPRHVRHQTGPFESAFEGYQASQKKDLNKWRDALTKAGEVSGFDLAETKGDESELIRRIVKRILIEVNKTPLFVTKHPIGLDSRIADLMKMLDIEAQGDARIVGIHAMGGMGKTTLAKAAYNQISSHFEACSFLSNIRESANQSSGLVSLQKQLVRNIFQDEHVDINSIDEGIGKILERIGTKKVLLVLDDVDDQSQLDALAGSSDWFCSGSRIIITTRDKGALREQRVNLYELKELNDAQSLQLFSWHAFEKEKPDAKFAELSKEIASIASGLPLALKVFGPLFGDLNTVELWVSKLKELKKYHDKGLHETLKISYHALDESAQEVFLDIACFFIGRDRENATYMWDDCGFFPDLKINVLICKCLVSVNDDTGEFEMHDLIRDMGRKIVQDKSKKEEGPSRLWEGDEKTRDILQNRRETKKTEAIKLNGSWTLHTACFAEMSGLRMLRLKGVRLEGTYDHIPHKLRWLEWCQYHWDSLPNELHVENVVVLDLSGSSILHLWSPGGPRIQVCNKLKVLNMSGCRWLNICPDFSRMPHLEKLDLSRCRDIRELHPSIGNLERLTYLSLEGCESLMELPTSIGYLKSLSYLSLEECFSLEKLPEEVCRLTSLENLNLKSCFEISTFPSQLGYSESSMQHLFEKLKVLDLSHWYRITKSPDFTSMPQLEKLIFTDCERMGELHPSIGHLKRLSYLSLRGCASLKKLPDELCQLAALKFLDLTSCIGITNLPLHLGELKSLRQLFLDDTKITTLPESMRDLIQLQYLSLEKCSSLKEIPECICALINLEVLNARKCVSLASLPNSLGNLRILI